METIRPAPCRVLITAPYVMSVLDYYRSRLEPAGCEMVVASVEERLSERELLPIIQDVDGIICGDDQITDRVLDHAPRLKVISKWGTGIDSINKVAATKRGIAVCNTPNAFSEPVADTVMGYILEHTRRLREMDGDIRGGRWRKPQLTALGELTLGVIGVGNCGKAVMRRARAFGMRLLGNDVVEMPEGFAESAGIRMLPRDELLREADVITLHTTLNPTSFHLIDETAIGLMKPSVFLINTSRGPVIDEAALARALDSKRIAGAALDVFEMEPLPDDSPLRQLDQCWLAPHNANSSLLAPQRVHDSTIRNLLEKLGRTEVL
jgi:D-3-phosphoglycerate dehydrogenase / 2-oxoglutarate reductase